MKSKTIWTKQATVQLKQIYTYIKYVQKSPQGAKNVLNDILNAGNSITFFEQFQKDEINPNYRRIIVRNFKLLYREENGRICIVQIYATAMDPERMFPTQE